MSTFNYVVDHINATANTVASYSIEHDALSGLEYSANPLATACDEQNGDSRKLRIRADRLQSTVIGSVSVCSSWTALQLLIDQVLGAIQMLFYHIGYGCNGLVHNF